MDQISQHEIRVYDAIKSHGGWVTAQEVAAAADVSGRTARGHAAAMATHGVLDVAKTFGGYRYRLRVDVSAPGQAYLSRLESAKRVFGM